MSFTNLVAVLASILILFRLVPKSVSPSSELISFIFLVYLEPGHQWLRLLGQHRQLSRHLGAGKLTPFSNRTYRCVPRINGLAFQFSLFNAACGKHLIILHAASIHFFGLIRLACSFKRFLALVSSSEANLVKFYLCFALEVMT